MRSPLTIRTWYSSGDVTSCPLNITVLFRIRASLCPLLLVYSFALVGTLVTIRRLFLPTHPVGRSIVSGEVLELNFVFLVFYKSKLFSLYFSYGPGPLPVQCPTPIVLEPYPSFGSWPHRVTRWPSDRSLLRPSYHFSVRVLTYTSTFHCRSSRWLPSFSVHLILLFLWVGSTSCRSGLSTGPNAGEVPWRTQIENRDV